MATSSSAGAGGQAPTNPHPIPLTESEVLIRGFLAANPDLSDDKSRPIEMMTDRYTNEEWKVQIDETINNVMKEVDSGARAEKVYQGPRMRSGEEALKELAKTVDHTVLKLDATTTTIDGLCGEARTENFKVCLFLEVLCYWLKMGKSFLFWLRDWDTRAARHRLQG
jgi:deoxyribose-phosphate aldolase